MQDAGIVRNRLKIESAVKNARAFLKLFQRTGDSLWLDRARAFAMHSIAQVERARGEHGRGRYTLWTGDPGAALYLADCLAGSGRVPLP